MQILLEMLWMLVLDLVFLGVLSIVVLPLGVFKRVAFAVLKRNFVGYFSNPTGYVFLCLFVLLTSFAAFWPHEFFASNLANFDQLNKYLPYIMLVFIPAITMSIWSDERRQGTDELLLTLPAADFDIVIGKYLAAAAVFTVSLMFSQLANYAVLVALTGGNLDSGLLFTTYFGYWLIGLAMLAIGMVASFLTSNLTVGFIFGAALNAPLAFASSADVVVPNANAARFIAHLSILEQFDSFGRGVVSLSSMVYFVMLVIVSLYLSIVLIGRRHWLGGRDGHSLLGHYLVRVVALVVIAFGLNLVVENTWLDRARLDATEGRVSSLAPDTKTLLNKLADRDRDAPKIVIDAYVGDEIPQDYVPVRFQLLSMLKEFRATAGDALEVHIHEDVAPFSEEAAEAERRFGIRPQTVRTQSRGAIRDEEVILGAAFSCGLQRRTVPFFDYGIPVEYELIRSINTVARGQRKKLGIVATDFPLLGDIVISNNQYVRVPPQQIIGELEKQYEIEFVDATNRIEDDKYDVLLVVQPSSLIQAEMDNLVDAIRRGQPTAIFEDPLSVFVTITGTNLPRQPSQFLGRPAGDKGDIRGLWKVLQIQGLLGKQVSQYEAPQSLVVWQSYNPYPKLQFQGFGPEFVFIRDETPGAEAPLNRNEPATRHLEEIMFPFPGAIEQAEGDDTLRFTTLIETGKAGTIGFMDYWNNRANPILLQIKRGADDGKYVLAAKIQSKSRETTATDQKQPAADAAKSADQSAKQTATGKPINVVYVADVDMLESRFVGARARPNEQVEFRFDNVTFILNVIDELAGDPDYIQIRSRKKKHSTLQVVERRTQFAREQEFEMRREFEVAYQKAEEKAVEETQTAIQKFVDDFEKIKKDAERGREVDPRELDYKKNAAAMQEAVRNQQLTERKQDLARQRDLEIQRIRRDMDLQVQKIQTQFKVWAVVLPPIPPLLIGLVVFVARRLREREGISRSRLR